MRIEGPIEAQEWLFEDQTPDFLIDFAHKAIDNGADAFVGHGPHVLRGVEIYKGKPIFYGLGEFFREWHYDGMLSGAFWANPTTGDDRSDPARVSTGYKPVNYESMIAVSRYDKGQLVEVRLYPTDGRFDGPASDLGIPRSAPPEIAQRILTRGAGAVEDVWHECRARRQRGCDSRCRWRVGHWWTIAVSSRVSSPRARRKRSAARSCKWISVMAPS